MSEVVERLEGEVGVRIFWSAETTDKDELGSSRGIGYR
jgi:hypothetical protein